MKFLCDSKRHLICEPYSIDNLHIMADILNIKRCWYHNCKFPHYDIPKKRISEISNKCEMISSKDLLSIIKGNM